VGVVVRGEQAIVAQLMNDKPPFEVETAHCSRERDGTWSEDHSGNSLGGFLPIADGIGTFVAWDEAPPGAVAARFVCRGRELVVPVENGCALAVFDEVEVADEIERLFDGPRLTAWIDDEGKEQTVEQHEASPWMRERVRERMGGHSSGTSTRPIGVTRFVERWRWIRNTPDA
jgi:hypothetical protein